MTAPASPAGRREAVALAVYLLVQGIAAVFFLGDALSDLISDPGAADTPFEAVVALALLLGLGFGAWRLRRVLERMRATDRALAAAQGALGSVIDTQFTAWGLTPAERDVALFALKGLDTAEIARLRGAAQGTVRAQLTRIYAKAGVSGRAQFAAWFVEDLLG